MDPARRISYRRLPQVRRPIAWRWRTGCLRRENPLFARVAVNRMWQELFGTGLVESAGDFGLTGDGPRIRKLLDWLAVEFRESGWDVKRLYRLLVLSATYRQSAHVTPELLQRRSSQSSARPRAALSGWMPR